MTNLKKNIPSPTFRVDYKTDLGNSTKSKYQLKKRAPKIPKT